MKVGDYVRTKKGYIAKYKGISKCNNIDGESEDWFIFDSTIIDDYGDRVPVEINKSYFIKTSPNIIDLIEYMDLLEVENPITTLAGFKLSLFNPVRCDGFTKYEDGRDCIILNLDYIVDIQKLKIKSVLTHEQYDNLKYKAG